MLVDDALDRTNQEAAKGFTFWHARGEYWEQLEDCACHWCVSQESWEMAAKKMDFVFANQLDAMEWTLAVCRGEY